MAKFDVVPMEKFATQKNEPQMKEEVIAPYRVAIDLAQQSNMVLLVKVNHDEKPIAIRNRVAQAVRQMALDDRLRVRRHGETIMVQPKSA